MSLESVAEKSAKAMLSGLELWQPDNLDREAWSEYLHAWALAALESLILEDLDSDNRKWHRTSFPAAIAAVIKGSRHLNPRLPVRRGLRSAYAAFDLPEPLVLITQEAHSGSVLADAALMNWRSAFGQIAEATEEHLQNQTPSIVRRRWLREFRRLTTDNGLILWTRPTTVDPNLDAIRGRRTQTLKVADKLTANMDRKSRRALIRFVRDVLRYSPHLRTYVPRVAMEGMYTLMSGHAEALRLSMDDIPKQDLLDGFPTPDRLVTPQDWKTLQIWKNWPSKLVVELCRAGETRSAQALLRCRAQVVRYAYDYSGRKDDRATDYAAHVASMTGELPLGIDSLIGRMLEDAKPPPEPKPKGGARPRSEPPHANRAGNGKSGPPDKEGALQAFDELIGLDEVKSQAHQIAKLAAVKQRRKEEDLADLGAGFHMVLAGNPGTGKTTVARLFGDLFKSLGILSKGHLVESAPSDFIGAYVGHTERKTRELIEKANGGVLFIDEAYGLTPKGTRNFADEAITVLVAAMENAREDLIVIAAGYEREMHDFLESNPGLRGRFTHHLTLPDMDDHALLSVFKQMTEKGQLSLAPGTSDAIQHAIRRIPRGPGFGNAREIRTLFEKSIEKQAQRIHEEPDLDITVLVPGDIPDGQEALSHERDDVIRSLESLVGLQAVKSEVKTIANLARAARLRREAGLPGGGESVGHMAFVGNPGTGKTTVARLLGQTLMLTNSLPRGHLVQATRSDLVGEHVGQTAPKTRKVFERALGGVLFIDEAYSLVPPDAGRDFGHEALSTLLPLMEDHEEHVVVVFAGYVHEMHRMISANPGLRSRIARFIEFPDYTPDEMQEIIDRMAVEKSLIFTPEASEKSRMLMERWPRDKDFGNARTANAILDRILENQANRLSPQNSIFAKQNLTQIEVADIPELSEAPDSGIPFGFR